MSNFIRSKWGELMWLMSRTAILLPAILMLAFGGTASAQTVYTADDFSDPNGTACLPDPSPVTTCSPRQALTAARNGTDEATIRLLPGTYKLTLGGETGVDDNQTGDLDWADLGPEQLADLRIEGAGSAQTTIDAGTLGSPNDRIIEFFSAQVAVSVSGVTLRGGVAGNASDGVEGGAIRTAMTGPLFLEDVRIVDNATLDLGAGDGGGIFSINDNLDLKNVTLFDNQAARFGGAIALNSGLGLDPNMTIRDSTIHGNTTEPSGLGGGAIANFGDGGPLEDPILTMVNSTIDSNRARGFGGAIDTFGGAHTEVVSSTVTRNVANSDGIGGEAGGGLQNGGGGYSVKNSLIALNTVGAGGVNPNCSAGVEFGSFGGNVIGDPTGCPGFDEPGDISVANPLVGPLSANGGPTLTVPLLAGSPALDRAANCPATDQRGTARPQGAACDSGAFELVPFELVPVTAPPCKGVQATVVGTAANDTLTGTEGDDVIFADAGNDRVNAGKGKDIVCGGMGKDALKGGAGKDRLFGEAGKDRLVGGKGKDRCVGGKGKDSLRGCEKGK